MKGRPVFHVRHRRHHAQITGRRLHQNIAKLVCGEKIFVWIGKVFGKCFTDSVYRFKVKVAPRISPLFFASSKKPRDDASANAFSENVFAEEQLVASFQKIRKAHFQKSARFFPVSVKKYFLLPDCSMIFPNSALRNNLRRIHQVPTVR